MNGLVLAIVLSAMGQGNRAEIEPAHARNAVFAALISEGFTADGATVRLESPTVRDGQNDDAQRAALREVAGSDGKLQELLRKSVAAPFILKVHDVKANDATLRVVDLWFVVHAEMTDVDPAKEAHKAQGQEVGAGNMTMRTELLDDAALRAAGIDPPASHPGDGPETWYARVHGRLLDRIAFVTTSQAVATRSKDSIVVASRTAPAFDKPGPTANAWQPVAGGDARPYRGGVSYAKISRLAIAPGALLVEMHGAFEEPHDWFQGAPILRSKFGVVAQDQIRRLRREAEKRAKGPAGS